MVEALIVISGKVHTVMFKEFVQMRAQELELEGYVEDQEDNTVEVCVQGSKESIEILIELLRKGPVFSDVFDVKVQWYEKPQDLYTGFEIWK
jgi:acylphosphatase